MANHCYNWVNFTGKKENLQKLVDGLEKAKALNEENEGLIWHDTFFLALGMEVPKEVVDVYDEFGSRYYVPCDIYFDGESVTIGGYSAWSPVSEFFLKLSSVYQVHFDSEYDEAGNDFGGFYSGENGVVTDDRQYTHAQYEWLQRDLESIDLDYHEFDSEKEAIEFFSSVKEVCGEKSWGVILEIISNHFKDKQ